MIVLVALVVVALALAWVRLPITVAHKYLVFIVMKLYNYTLLQLHAYTVTWLQ